MRALHTVFAAVLAGCGEHQYLGIPGAVLVAGSPNYTYDQAYQGATPPMVTVTEGDGTLVPGEHLTLRVDFSAIAELEVTELVVLDLEGASLYHSHWRLDLTDEELAQGFAEVEVHALAEEPAMEWCARDYRGVPSTCYQRADEGETGVGLVAAGGDMTSAPVVVPITLAPLAGSEPDACLGFTAADCCSGGGGVSVLQCSWPPECACPSGTGEAGFDGAGYRLCDCPT